MSRVLHASQWFELGSGDILACVGPHLRRRNGVRPPLRFLVLGPREHSPVIARPVMCSGAWIDGRAVIESGVLGLELLSALERKIREVLECG